MNNRPDRKTMELKCFLSDEEKAALSEDLVRTFEEIQEWEVAMARYAANYKAEMKKKLEHQSHIVTTLSKGYEYRDVVCAVIYNSPRSGLKTIVRVDAPGEVVREESMTEDERQENLFSPAAPECAGCANPAVYYPVADGFHKARDGEGAPLTCKAPPTQEPADGFRLEAEPLEHDPPAVVPDVIPQAQAPQQQAAND